MDNPPAPLQRERGAATQRDAVYPPSWESSRGTYRQPLVLGAPKPLGRNPRRQAARSWCPSRRRSTTPPEENSLDRPKGDPGRLRRPEGPTPYRPSYHLNPGSVTGRAGCRGMRRVPGVVPKAPFTPHLRMVQEPPPKLLD